jgi:5-formyltetrahydrofolate cyclo-ligase
VAFSATGDRLGMGGGYYDRSFAFRLQSSAPPRLVGVGYGFQRHDGLRAEPWDVPLDAVVTEDGLLACRA